MIAWILGIAFVLFLVDLIFTKGKISRMSFRDFMSMFIGVALIVMFFQWLFSK